LRTIPVLVDIAQTMAEVCPQAWCLSYADPMAMTTWAVRSATSFGRLAGLCHAVRDTHAMLAETVGRDLSTVSFLTAGVNHQSFVLRFEADGRSLYPDLDARLAEDPQSAHNVRAELYRRFGYFPTESSEHAAEYVPWFMRHDDQLARFAIPPEEYLRRSGKKLHAYEGVRRALAAGRPMLIQWQHLELASEFITAMLTGRGREISMTVPNDGLINNLPAQCCVEVPAWVDDQGVAPVAVPDYPAQLAALNRTFLNVVELTVLAALEGRRSHVYHAAMLDPNTAATLTLPAIHDLCDELIAAHGGLLPAGIGPQDDMIMARHPAPAGQRTEGKA
jgi:alpha-galactosidase